MQPIRLTQPLYLIRGATFRQAFLMQQPTINYKDITGGQSFPLELKVPGHGLVNGWPIWVEGVTGIPELNRPYGGQPLFGEVVDVDTLRFSTISGINRPRPTGGKIIFNLPVDLAGATAKVELLDLAEPSEVLISTVVDAGGTVTISMAPGDTAGISWERAKFALWLTLSNGDRDCWLTGEIVAEGVAP